MNFGIIGLGKQGLQHLKALLALADFDEGLKIYVCDLDKEYIDSVCKSCGGG